jgi:hypothetical protein
MSGRGYEVVADWRVLTPCAVRCQGVAAAVRTDEGLTAADRAWATRRRHSGGNEECHRVHRRHKAAATESEAAAWPAAGGHATGRSVMASRVAWARVGTPP